MARRISGRFDGFFRFEPLRRYRDLQYEERRTSVAQVTSADSGYPLALTPDGTSLYFVSAIERTLHRIPASGGVAEVVIAERRSRYAISADGKMVAYAGIDGENRTIVVKDLQNGKHIRSFRIEGQNSRLPGIAWMPKNNGLLYVASSNDGGSNEVWLQPFEGGRPKNILNTGDMFVGGFAVTPDGKNFVMVRNGWNFDAILLTAIQK